jgi:Putative Flp pilus-assembly TadE/G-like
VRRRTDRGQVTVLMVGLAVLLVYVIAAVSDLSAGHLRRETARSFADGAALAAANGAAVPAGYSGGGHFVALDPDTARAAVDRYVRQTDTARSVPGTRWSVTVAGRVVTVDVTMPFDFPIRMPLFGSASTVRASGSATVPIY